MKARFLVLSNNRLFWGVSFALIFHILLLIKISNFVSKNQQISNNIGDFSSINISYYNIQKQQIKKNSQNLSEARKVNKKPVLENSEKLAERNLQNKSQPINNKDKSEEVVDYKSNIEKQLDKIVNNDSQIPVSESFSTKGYRQMPKYPSRALKLRQQDIVHIRVLLSEFGVSEKIEFSKKSIYPLLNQAAIEAVKKWRFNPVVIDGKAIKSWVEIPIEFKIG